MEKQRWEKPEKRKEEKRLSEKRKSQKKEDAGARKGRKVTNHFVFPVICGSGWSKSTLAKAAGAEARLEMKIAGRCCGAKHMFKSILEVVMLKKRTPFLRAAHVEVKTYTAPQRLTTFGSRDREKV